MKQQIGIQAFWVKKISSLRASNNENQSPIYVVPCNHLVVHTTYCVKHGHHEKYRTKNFTNVKHLKPLKPKFSTCILKEERSFAYIHPRSLELPWLKFQKCIETTISLWRPWFFFLPIISRVKCNIGAPNFGGCLDWFG